MKIVEKIYERVIVTPYKTDGYCALDYAIIKIANDVEKIKIEYNDQFIVRVIIEKLEN